MEQLNETLYEIFILVTLGMSIYMGLKLNYIYFIIPVILFIIVAKYKSHKKSEKLQKRKKEIESCWGQVKSIKQNDVSKKKNRDYSNVDSLYKALSEQDSEFQIDDITWRDLNMDIILQKLDYTMSFAGAHYLYYILRKPLFSKKDIEKRNEQIEVLQKNRDTSIIFQQHLDNLGTNNVGGLNDYLAGRQLFKSRSTILFRALSCSLALLPILIIYTPLLGIYAAISILLINIAVYNKVKGEIASELSAFKYFGRLIRCTEQIVKLDTPDNIIDVKKCTDALNETKQIKKLIKKICYSGNFAEGGSIKSDIELILEYFNMVTLKEPIIFFKAADLLNQQYKNMKILQTELGRLDAYISIASYRDSLAYYTKPYFYEDKLESIINCIDIYHPLLSDPVANSIELAGKGALITGSNASGKSTFLRTIGINSVFAQTICTVLAKDFKANLFKVMTSIGNVDSIIDGDSYFMTEAKSLKRVIDDLEKGDHVLCILDEIFRGTNTVERISGATAVLNYLHKHNCCVIAATHDIELTKLISESFSNYHFQEEVNENDIYFDYKLHIGACTSRNAILILRQLGYPESIYKEAISMALSFNN